MSTYERIRKLVDSDLSHGPRLLPDGTMGGYGEIKPGIIYAVAAIPLFVAAFFHGSSQTGLNPIWWVIALAFSLPAFTFVGWRQVRVLKARTLKSGRFYERKGRYFLPPEYQDTTVATLERRRNS